MVTIDTKTHFGSRHIRLLARLLALYMTLISPHTSYGGFYSVFMYLMEQLVLPPLNVTGCSLQMIAYKHFGWMELHFHYKNGIMGMKLCETQARVVTALLAWVRVELFDYSLRVLHLFYTFFTRQVTNSKIKKIRFNKKFGHTLGLSQFWNKSF